MADQTYDDLNETEIEGAGGTQATHAASSLNSSTSRGHPALRWVQDRVQERDFTNVGSDLTMEIREHPVRSMVLALGAGYLLSKIID